MTINSGFSHKKIVIFNSYVKLPEGKGQFISQLRNLMDSTTITGQLIPFLLVPSPSRTGRPAMRGPSPRESSPPWIFV